MSITKSQPQFLFAPRVIAANQRKVLPFRIQEDSENRYPLGRFPFKVDVSFGGVSRRSDALHINGHTAVNNSLDKMRTKKIWSQNLIPHTLNYTLVTDFIETINDNKVFNLDKFELKFEYPIVAKLRTGEKGKGFTYIKNKEELETFLRNNLNKLNRYFFEDMVVFDQEYRIHGSPHLAGLGITYNYDYLKTRFNHYRTNGVINITRKLIKQESYENGVRHTNRAGNWDHIVTTEFGIPNTESFNNMCSQAIKALQVLGLDFGFIDVGYNSTSDVYTFFESGSNPELNKWETQCYLKAFPHIILQVGKKNKKLPEGYIHSFNITANKAPKSIVLTNNTSVTYKVITL